MTIDLTARFRTRLRGIHQWIIDHDESWLFVAAYIGLAVVLSIWISLFWLVAVVGVHFAFEWIRQQSQREGSFAVLMEVLWELKLDFALILFALALSLYMEIILGVIGLRSAARLAPAARAGLRGSARFAAWERALRGVLLSVDDAAQVFRAVGVRRGADDGEKRFEKSLYTEGAEPAGEVEVIKTAAAPASIGGSWAGPWGKGDWIAAGLGVLCIALIILAPWLTGHTFATALTTLAVELHPFP